MREAFRPFSKVVTISNQDHNVVFFKDDQGNNIDCNYVQVEAVSGNTGEDSIFSIVPFPVNTTTAANAYLTASGIADSASGTYGGVANVGTGTVVLSVSPSDSMNGVRLSHSTASTIVYSVLYGNVTPINPLSDRRGSSR